MFSGPSATIKHGRRSSAIALEWASFDFYVHIVDVYLKFMSRPALQLIKLGTFLTLYDTPRCSSPA